MVQRIAGNKMTLTAVPDNLQTSQSCLKIKKIDLVSKGTVVLCQWRTETQKLGIK